MIYGNMEEMQLCCGKVHTYDYISNTLRFFVNNEIISSFWRVTLK